MIMMTILHAIMMTNMKNTMMTTTIMNTTVITIMNTITNTSLGMAILIMMTANTGMNVNLWMIGVTVWVLTTTVNGSMMMMVCITHTIVMMMTAIIVYMIPLTGLVIVTLMTKLKNGWTRNAMKVTAIMNATVTTTIMLNTGVMITIWYTIKIMKVV